MKLFCFCELNATKYCHLTKMFDVTCPNDSFLVLHALSNGTD